MIVLNILAFYISTMYLISAYYIRKHGAVRRHAVDEFKRK